MAKRKEKNWRNYTFKVVSHHFSWYCNIWCQITVKYWLPKKKIIRNQLLISVDLMPKKEDRNDLGAAKSNSGYKRQLVVAITRQTTTALHSWTEGLFVYGVSFAPKCWDPEAGKQPVRRQAKFSSDDEAVSISKATLYRNSKQRTTTYRFLSIDLCRVSSSRRGTNKVSRF